MPLKAWPPAKTLGCVTAQVLHANSHTENVRLHQVELCCLVSSLCFKLSLTAETNQKRSSRLLYPSRSFSRLVAEREREIVDCVSVCVWQFGISWRSFLLPSERNHPGPLSRPTHRLTRYCSQRETDRHGSSVEPHWVWRCTNIEAHW